MGDNLYFVKHGNWYGPGNGHDFRKEA